MLQLLIWQGFADCGNAIKFEEEFRSLSVRSVAVCMKCRRRQHNDLSRYQALSASNKQCMQGRHSSERNLGELNNGMAYIGRFYCIILHLSCP